MTLQEKIKDETKKSMIAKNGVRTTTLRGVTAAFMTEAITKKVPDLAEADAVAVVKRLVKQRKDSIEQFTKGGREDLAENEKAELAILEEFLPKMMAREEIVKIAEAKKAEMNVTDKSKLGVLVGAVMKETKGLADGGEVKAVAGLLLACQPDHFSKNFVLV